MVAAIRRWKAPDGWIQRWRERCWRPVRASTRTSTPKEQRYGMRLVEANGAWSASCWRPVQTPADRWPCRPRNVCGESEKPPFTAIARQRTTCCQPSMTLTECFGCWRVRTRRDP